MAASIESLFSDISAADDPVEGLRTLKTALYSAPVSAVREAVSAQRLRLIFTLLDSRSKEQLDVCVDVLERVLSTLSPLHLSQNYTSELHTGLNHEHHTVRALALTQIGRVVEHPEGVSEILPHTELLRAVAQALGDQNMSVAKQALHSLSNLSRSKPGLEKLFESDLLKTLKDVMSISDVVRYRVYELVVEVASFSPSSLGFCVNSGLVSQLLSELTGDDVLIRVTAVEMVTHLAQTQHGRRFLMEQGVMDQISDMIRDADADPFSSLYLPGLVRFFGNVAMVASPQQVCESYPAFLTRVLEMVLNPDLAVVNVALDTLGLLGSTVEGKQVLHKTGEKFRSVLERMSFIVNTDTTELRVRCLDALSQLLTLQPEHQTEDLLALTESWFHLLSKQPMDMIQKISIQPFPELHCCALHIFTAIALQPWGQRLMMNTPGFMEFVLDRSTSPTKDAKDAKFALVSSLLGSSSAPDILGAHNCLRLKTYLKEGPYYVTAVAAVGTEGAN